MKVEIWSDIMCPFYYIGKRNFELALSSLLHRDLIAVEGKSFQLDPSIPEAPEHQDDLYRFLLCGILIKAEFKVPSGK